MTGRPADSEPEDPSESLTCFVASLLCKDFPFSVRNSRLMASTNR